VKNLLLLTQITLICTGSALAASSKFGSTDAGSCYQATLIPFSNQSVIHCNNAISNGDLSRRDLAATYSNRGIIHLRNGNIDKALRDQNRAVRIIPGQPQFHVIRGNALYYAHEYESALEEYDIVIASDSDRLTDTTYNISLYNKALTLLKLQRFSDARSTLELALKSNPESRKIKDKLADIASLSELPDSR